METNIMNDNVWNQVFNTWATFSCENFHVILKQITCFDCEKTIFLWLCISRYKVETKLL